MALVTVKVNCILNQLEKLEAARSAFLLLPFWLPFLALLGLTGLYFALLGLTGPYMALLGLTWPYWALLDLTGPYWALLGHTGPYWA